MFLYINGVKEAATNTYTAPIETPTNRIHIATDGSNNSWEFKGMLDEAAIFNYGLSEAQVNQIYNNGLAANLTSLSPINWWRLGEDAYFVNNNITIPNQVAGGDSCTGSGTQTSMLVADAPGSYGSGSGVNLDIFDRVGEAPGTSPINVGNSQSYNMIPENRHGYVPGYVPAQVNNVASMSFDGVNDYMVVDPAAFSASNDDFSISFWYFRSSNPSNHESVIFKFSNFEIYQHPNGQAFWTYFAGISSNTNKIPIVLNDWQHICYVVTSTGFKGYQQGSLVAENTFPSTLSYGGTGNSLLFGGQVGVKACNIKLDEIAFFNYALTPRQIKEDIYNASKPISGVNKTADLNNNSNLTAPVAWYRMGD